jgi:hypothetical protein
MTTIAITFKAFQRYADTLQERDKVAISTARLDTELPAVNDEAILDMIYKVTNLQSELAEFGASAYEINLWNEIQKVLPAKRSHTSISVGDEIQIADRLYSVEMSGFKQLCCENCR